MTLRSVLLASLSISTLLALSACDSPGGGKSGFASDVVVDTSSSSDVPLFTSTDSATTTASGDTSVAPDTSTPADTSVAPDTATPDTVSSVCAQGCLPATPTAGPTVAFTQHDAMVAPPTLGGGAAPSGQWRLTSVDIYPYGTFTDGFTMTVSNEGDTRGRANFSGDAMQLALHLDLHIYVDAFGTTGDGAGSADVAVGGCHDVDDPYLVGDFDQCAAGWPDSVTPPNELMYETKSGALKLLLELEPEFLISMLPADQQESAAFVIVGPLVLVASFVHP